MVEESGVKHKNIDLIVCIYLPIQIDIDYLCMNGWMDG